MVSLIGQSWNWIHALIQNRMRYPLRHPFSRMRYPLRHPFSRNIIAGSVKIDCSLDAFSLLSCRFSANVSVLTTPRERIVISVLISSMIDRGSRLGERTQANVKVWPRVPFTLCWCLHLSIVYGYGGFPGHIPALACDTGLIKMSKIWNVWQAVHSNCVWTLWPGGYITDH